MAYTNGGGDVLLHPTIGSDITKDVMKLIGKLDVIFELHSFLPQDPEKDLCVTYLQTGICNVQCNFHHPLMSRPPVDAPSCPVHDLIYIFERTAALTKIVSHEATHDIANVIKPVCKIMKNQFQTYVTEYNYGDVAYLYDECTLRILASMRVFASKKPSPKQYFKKVYNVKPPTNSLLEICIMELRVLHDNFQKYENAFHKKTEDSLASLVSSGTPSGILQTLTSDMLSHADTAQALHDMHQTGLTTLLQKIKSVLEALWKTSNSKNTFEISSCGLTPSALNITPHTSPICFLISRPVTAENKQFTRAQTLEGVAMALANNGFSVIENSTDGHGPLLTVVLSEQEQNKPQQLINFLLNDRVAGLNTQLFASYNDTDIRVRPLVLAVQQWARVRGCCDPDNATLSLYGWTLMVIHFLRQHADFALPSLQQVGLLAEATTKKNLTKNGKNVATVDNITTNESVALAPLLVQFFLYYGTCSTNGFQPFHAIVSLRNDQKIFKRDSHFIANNNNNRSSSNSNSNSTNSSIIPCMTAQEAVQAMCPDNAVVKRSEEVESVKSHELLVTSDYEGDTNDYTDRENSSNTSHQSCRGGGGRQQMLVYATGIPSWQLCMEDPLEEKDIGAVMFCRTGQAHIWNEMRRALSLFHDITTPSDNNNSGSEQNERNYWNELCIPNNSVPQAAKTCSICGQEGHRDSSCELLRCQLCNETGHFMRDCLLNFCSNCRKQGHFAKDCDLPKTCRHCKQPGHLIKDCPQNVCTKCGSHKHITSNCAHKNASATKAKPYHKRTKSSERNKSLEKLRSSGGSINASAEYILNEHEILPARRHRFDSFDIDLTSLDSRGSENSRSSRRKRRPHHHTQTQSHTQDPNNQSQKKESKPLPKENKVVVPSLQPPDSAPKSRMPWNTNANSSRPQVNIINTSLKQRFFSNIYSPQSSPYSSPREYSGTAAGKISNRAPGALQKPSEHTREVKPSKSNHFKLQGNRSRRGSISAVTGAGYSSAGTGYSSASPRNYIPPSPIANRSTSPRGFHKADSKVDSSAHHKLPAKPQSVSLQKKMVAPSAQLSAKAESRERASSVPGSPVRSMHDIKLSSSSGVSSDNRKFTTPYSPGGSSQSSPDSSSPGIKLSLSVGEQQQEQKKELKKEKKRSSQRKKQAKRIGGSDGGGGGAKPSLYIDDEVSETESVGNELYFDHEGGQDVKMSYAKAIMQHRYGHGIQQQKANGRVIEGEEERYSFDKAEEKIEDGLSLDYADCLDYI